MPSEKNFVNPAKPHPPSGEIHISDLGKDAATLSWNPPIEDQIPIDEYVIEVKSESNARPSPVHKCVV